MGPRICRCGVLGKMAKTTQEEHLKKLLICAGAAFLLSGCVTLIEPPESSYNGNFLQLFAKADDRFMYQFEFEGEAECATIAANVGKFTPAEVGRGFCQPQPNPRAIYRTWFVDTDTKLLFKGSFFDERSCTDFEKQKLAGSKILYGCEKYKP